MLYVKAKGMFLFCLNFLFPLALFSQSFVIADGILDARAAGKIEEMGAELYAKSGIKVLLVAQKSAQGEEILSFQKRMSAELKEPHVILTLFLEEKKVDIIHSASLEAMFDKEATLSPLPWRGTILPLLTSKNKESGVSAALLNGYADIVDQIAQHQKITLESSIGSANKTTIGMVKVLVYGFLAVLLIVFIRRRIRGYGKNANV